MDQIGNADQWGQYGGILGLVIFALFLLLGSLATAVLWRFIKAEDARQEFFERVLKNHEAERNAWQNIARDAVTAITSNTSATDSFRAELSDMSKQIIGALANHGGKRSI